jgi:hypothetical protein
LQQATGAIVKLPDDSQQTSASEVPVKIIGPFQASQVKFCLNYFFFIEILSFSLLNDVFNP